MLKRCSILWFKFNSLSRVVFLKKIFWVTFKKKFYSLSRIQQKSSILWVILKKEVQFFDSYWKRFNSLSHVKKINSLSLKKNKSLSHMKRFNNRVEFLGWVIYFHKRFNSYGFFFKKRGSILWVMFKRRFKFLSHKTRFNSLSQCKKSKFFESFFKGFNSLSNFVFLKKFNSWCQIQKSSILWVMLKRWFNSLSHVQKKVQFFESFFNGFNSWRHIRKRVQF